MRKHLKLNPDKIKVVLVKQVERAPSDGRFRSESMNIPETNLIDRKNNFVFLLGTLK